MLKHHQRSLHSNNNIVLKRSVKSDDYALVYFPMAHMDWGITGFMNGIWNSSSTIKAIDFAGGTVVHMTSGWSALVLCLILGPRLRFKKEPMPPHSMVLCMVGTGMLWVGLVRIQCG
jgi:Amt family ammonium transporter